MHRRFGRRADSDHLAPDLHDRILRTGRAPHRGATNVIGHVQRRLLAGVLVFVPIFVTYFVVDLFYGIIDTLLDPIIRQLNIPHGPGVDIADIGEIIIILILLYGTGLLIGWAVTRLVINRIHSTIERVPVIGPVYSTTRHGIDFLSNTQANDYRGVVLLEFPRPGVYSVGLITSDLGKLDGQENFLSIYVPTTPVPSSGFLVMVPSSTVTPTDITVEEAMRMIISGGILAGEIFANRTIWDDDSRHGGGWSWGSPSVESAPDATPPETRDDTERHPTPTTRQPD